MYNYRTVTLSQTSEGIKSCSTKRVFKELSCESLPLFPWDTGFCSRQRDSIRGGGLSKYPRIETAGVLR